MKLTPGRMRLLFNLYGPYLGAGVQVSRISPDWRELTVTLKLHWYNRNAVGTHFGGSLYSMVDPHLMILLMNLLGRDYVVWDQSARIVFVRAVKGPVHAVVAISAAREAEIREQARGGGKVLPEFEIQILDEQEQMVAQVSKVLYVRLRQQTVAKPPAAH